nr:MAG TPA: hypothetical protein [Caudoviricetes sp.]
MAGTKINKDNVSKFIEEARNANTKEKAKNARDYEAMLMEMIREEFKGM